MQQLSQGITGGSDVQQQAVATGNTLKALRPTGSRCMPVNLLTDFLLIVAAAVLLGLY